MLSNVNTTLERVDISSFMHIRTDDIDKASRN